LGVAVVGELSKIFKVVVLLFVKVFKVIVLFFVKVFKIILFVVLFIKFFKLLLVVVLFIKFLKFILLLLSFKIHKELSWCYVSNSIVGEVFEFVVSADTHLTSVGSIGNSDKLSLLVIQEVSV
jgi:hypothetical protein